MIKSGANTHTKRVLLELRQRIISGKITGGQRLYEVALADNLQVSRTPIREAMSRLAEEGLLERASGGGFAVRSFSYKDVVDAIEIRGMLEGTAARIAAERGVEPDQLVKAKQILKALDGCFGEILTDIDFDQYSDLNAQFHILIAELSGSNIIIRELDRAKSLPFASPSAFIPDNTEIRALQISFVVAQQQHVALINAIESREGARAEAIAREHARIARSNLEYSFGLDDGPFENASSLALVVK